MKRRKKRVRELRYLVGVPIPVLDREGRRLSEARVNRWVTRALEEFRDCFGGGTVVPAPGTNVVMNRKGQGVTKLYEDGQMLVMAACRNREEFLRHRARIGSFAEQLGSALNQDSVFVLAFASDCVLIELP